MAKGKRKKRAFISSWRGDSLAFCLSRMRERRKRVDTAKRAPTSKVGRGVVGLGLRSLLPGLLRGEKAFPQPLA
jgi:hypothetical protein